MDARLRRLEEMAGMNESEEQRLWDELMEQIGRTMDLSPIPYPAQTKPNQDL
ncbi:hypothetical protein GCM10025772_12210 [Ferrimonas gelatinilytica]|uniref:Uncharacterized protein n=2 Tax=Ferrimonas gelatinilytica TaxID=1255257 RepID=A0ABP9S259_9GAMM